MARACPRLSGTGHMSPFRTSGPGPAPAPPSPVSRAGQTGQARAPRNAYQAIPASSDRTQPCPNRNGIWPPIYKRQWNPHPPRTTDKRAQQTFYRCVQDAVADGELHRTTGDVILAFARQSDDLLTDVFIAQATVAKRLDLAESTVCHHVAAAKRLGWIAVQHRNRVDNGVVLGMTNMTRLQLPQHWQERLDAQRRERRADQTRQRRQNGGRVTPAPKTPKRTSSAAHEPVHRTALDLAASTGAAMAMSASTTSFEQGRQELENQFGGQAHLYERAYAEFHEIWRTTRKNE